MEGVGLDAGQFDPLAVYVAARCGAGGSGVLAYSWGRLWFWLGLGFSEPLAEGLRVGWG